MGVVNASMETIDVMNEKTGKAAGLEAQNKIEAQRENENNP